MNRDYRLFTYRDARFRICCEQFDAVAAEIVRQRQILEDYIAADPRFAASFAPVDVLPGAPPVARWMAEAARAAGVGPMAAVAGAMAELAGRAGLAAGAAEAIVDNGGDIFVAARAPVEVGLYAGTARLGDRLGLAVLPEDMPLAVCSSSGRMGRSASLGDCDLATVVAKDTALADAAATLAANLVRRIDDVNPALERVCSVAGVLGVLIVKDDRVGLAGRLPRLIRRS